MEGQPGAAGSALGMLRRGWKVDPVIAFTKQQDVVHRVVGPPGIVLVGEGNPNRLRTLLASERRKHERVAAEIPIHEVICGNGEGEVPLPKLVKHVTKLGRNVKPAELTDVLNRLKALDANRSNIPLPKGPVPDQHEGHARPDARQHAPVADPASGHAAARRSRWPGGACDVDRLAPVEELDLRLGRGAAHVDLRSPSAASGPRRRARCRSRALGAARPGPGAP